MPGPHSLWLLFVLAVSTSGSQLQAQQVGDRVRVFVAGATATYVGQVTAVSDDRLELSDGTRAWSVAFSGMSRLERSTGTQSRWREGLLFGGYIGAYGGVAIGGVMSSVFLVVCGFFDDSFDSCIGPILKTALVIGAGLATVGALAGMGIGSLLRTETWTSVPIGAKKIEYTPTIRPRAGPDGIGLSLGVRMRF